jgi:hypothetical protein
MKNKRVTIYLDESKEVICYMTDLLAREVVDQIYQLFTKELTDNCLEIISEYDGIRETILIRADKIKFCRISDSE